MELRAEAERLTVRNAELTTQLTSAVGRVGQLTVLERDEAIRAATVESQLKAALAECSRLTSQLVQLRTAEKGWLAERRAFMKQLQAPTVSTVGGTTAPTGGPTLSPKQSATSPQKSRKTTSTHGKDLRALASQELEEALAEARVKARAEQVV